MVHLAIIGDIHHSFSQFDVDYFSQSAYDLLLLTGDLPFQGDKKDWHLVEKLASITKPALLIPGNHDCVTKIQFMAEAIGQAGLAAIGKRRRHNLMEELRMILHPVDICGYSAHEFCVDSHSFTLIATRPLSFGGPRLSYSNLLNEYYAVTSMNDSVMRLQLLVDSAKSNSLVFLGHNGPSGLGFSQDDIWGCDFRREAGDYGDPDYAAAVGYAKQIGKRVPLVIGGHMHRTLQDGRERTWHIEHAGTNFVNAARVPRIFERGSRTVHHHIHVEFDEHSIRVHEKLVAS